MTIADDFWMRSQVAHANLLHLTSYQTAFMGTAALQAWHLTLTAPVAFWSAMARVSHDGAAAMAPLADAVAATTEQVAKTAEVVQMPVPAASVAEPEPAPKAAKPKAAKPKVAPKTAAPEPATAKAAKPAKPKAPKAAAAPAPAKVEPVALAPNPLLLDAPRGGKADDLKLLSGIGPKLETALNEFGIYHFDQIATLNDEGIAWLNENQKGFAMTAERFDLVGQAKARLDG